MPPNVLRHVDGYSARAACLRGEPAPLRASPWMGRPRPRQSASVTRGILLAHGINCSGLSARYQARLARQAVMQQASPRLHWRRSAITPFFPAQTNRRRLREPWLSPGREGASTRTSFHANLVGLLQLLHGRCTPRRRGVADVCVAQTACAATFITVPGHRWMTRRDSTHSCRSRERDHAVPGAERLRQWDKKTAWNSTRD